MRTVRAAWMAALLPAFVLTGCGALVSPQQHIAAARRDIKAGDWQRARIELNKAIESKGRHPQAWLLLAEVSLDTADLNGAKTALSAALAAGAKGAEVDALHVRMWLATDQAAAVVQAAASHTIQLGEPAQTLAVARAYVALRRQDEAMKALQPLLAGAHAPFEAHLLMAESLALAGDARAALTELDAASRQDPRSAETALLRGRILESLGQPADAERELSLALHNMSPSEPLTQRVSALSALAEAQLAQGKLDAAAHSQAVLAKMTRDAPRSQFLAARIKLARGDRRDAIEELEMLVGNAPDFVQARLMLGAELLASGTLEEAQAQLTRAVQQAPNDPEALELLASTDLRLQQPNAVLTVLRPVLAAPSPDARLLALAGVATGQLGDANAVLSAFELGNGIDAGNETVRLNLARACLSAAHPDEALELLEKSSGDDPRRESLLVTALLAARGPRTADAEVARLLAERPPTRAALGVAAEYYVTRRQFDRARAVLLEALRLDPGNLSVTLSLAHVELANGDAAAAQLTLRAALAKHPDAIVIRLALADVLLRIRAFAEAKNLLETPQSSSSAAAIELELARVALAQGDLATANTELDRAIASQAGAPAVAEQAVAVLLAARQNDAALERVRVQLAHNPADPAALILEGDAQSALGRSAEALAAFAQAQKLRPSGELAVRLFQQRLATHEAQPQGPLVNWLASHPADWRVRETLAEYDLQTHDLEPAAHELEAVLKQAPDDLAALNNLAWIYTSTDPSRAQSLAEKAYQLAPLSPDVNDTLGWILAREGDFHRAVPMLAEAVKLDPADPQVQYHYAYILFKSGRRADAHRILTSLLAGSKPFESRSDAEQLLDETGGTRVHP